MDRPKERSSEMTDGLRILVVGAGSPNADMVAEVLGANSLQAEWTNRISLPNPVSLRKFDLVYGIYLQTCSRYIIVAKLLGKRTIVHFVGSDAYWMARERSIWRRMYWKLVLHLADLVFYVSPHLEDFVRREGFTLPFPIASSDFQSPQLRSIQPDRDVLYYCPSGEQNARIYRLSWITDYAREHPDEQITIVGNISHPADYDLKLPNVEVVPFVERSAMPTFYRRHRKLIRMTTEDGLPRMVHEALLCGLQVIFNGEAIKIIPKERDPKEFAKSFLQALNERWPPQHPTAG
jgi:hypothetical protein